MFLNFSIMVYFTLWLTKLLTEVHAINFEGVLVIVSLASRFWSISPYLVFFSSQTHSIIPCYAVNFPTDFKTNTFCSFLLFTCILSLSSLICYSASELFLFHLWSPVMTSNCSFVISLSFPVHYELPVPYCLGFDEIF